MARGRGGRGRGRGRGHRSRLGTRRYGSGYSTGGFIYHKMEMDLIASNITPPFLFNGVLTFSGKDSTVANYLNTFDPERDIQTPDLNTMMNQPAFIEMANRYYFPNPMVNNLNLTEETLGPQDVNIGSIDGVSAVAPPPLLAQFPPTMDEGLRQQQMMQMMQAQMQQQSKTIQQLNVITVG